MHNWVQFLDYFDFLNCLIHLCASHNLVVDFSSCLSPNQKVVEVVSLANKTFACFAMQCLLPKMVMTALFSSHRLSLKSSRETPHPPKKKCIEENDTALQSQRYAPDTAISNMD